MTNNAPALTPELSQELTQKISLILIDADISTHAAIGLLENLKLSLFFSAAELNLDKIEALAAEMIAADAKEE